MKTYRVKDWDKHYETAETRKLVSLRWLPIPNKHDGLGFRRIAAQKDAAELFTAWILILQVASKGRGPEERGNLLRGQETLGDEDLAIMTGFPKAIFTRALSFFSNPKQAWLIVHDDDLNKSPGTPADSPVITGSSPAVWNGMEGMEGNGKSPPAAEDDAIIIYNSYPRKVGRKVALKAIEACLKAHKAEIVLDLTKRFAEAVACWSEADKQFIPHPATWFNRESFLDDQTTWRRRGSFQDPPLRQVGL